MRKSLENILTNYKPLHSKSQPNMTYVGLCFPDGLLISCIQTATLICYEELYILCTNSDLASVYTEVWHLATVSEFISGVCFSVNTAGVWFLRGWYKPTWKTYRHTNTPMYGGVYVYVSHVKICAFKCMFV